MRVGFAGTPEFAARALEVLVAARYDVPLVLTQPDRPAGRGQRLQASAVKKVAAAHGLTIAQPRSLRLDGRFADDAIESQVVLQAAHLDVLVVAAYGLILPPWVLALPTRGCLNIHASLLPRWRGAAPIQRAIEAGDSHTGITLMQMDAGLDTGPMLATCETPIGPDDTSASLHERLAEIGARQLLACLADLQHARLQPMAQPEAGVTHAAKIVKSEAAIDWRRPAAEIERRLRAFDPAPGCTATIDGEAVKVWRGQVSDAADGAAQRAKNAVTDGSQASADGSLATGQRLSSADGRLRIVCGDGVLELLQLQRPGGRRVDAAEFLRGARAQAVGGGDR
ncbi:MAG: methionyl-tRNA formyltransferase [Rubrivivax sp.]